MEQIPSWEANRSHLVKKFLPFYGTRRFITAFTNARHVSLSWASSNQSMPQNSTSWRSILILLTPLSLWLPSGLISSRYPTKTLYTLLLSPIHATCHTHLILLEFITRKILGKEYRSFSSSMCSFLHSPVIASLLGPNILLNTIFSRKIIVLCILNFKFLDCKIEGKIFRTEW